MSSLPLKRKRHLNDPFDYQRAQLEHLLTHPPPPSSSSSSSSSLSTSSLSTPPPSALSSVHQKVMAELGPVKDFVSNIQGSSAGAGSGDFHVYRAHRRRELLRQKYMEEELVVEHKEKEFQLKREVTQAKLQSKLEKHQKKRAKKKAAKLAWQATHSSPSLSAKGSDLSDKQSVKQVVVVEVEGSPCFNEENKLESKSEKEKLGSEDSQ